MKEKMTLKWEMGTAPAEKVKWVLGNTAERISERTDGELSIELHGVEFVPDNELVNAVASGKLDMASFAYTGGVGPVIFPHCNVSSLPCWLNGEAGSAFTKALVDKYVKSEMEAFGVTPIALEINSAYDFGYFTAPYLCQVWSNKMFTSLKEAAGARISAQLVMSGDACSVIGMEPKIMTYAEMKPALAADSLDGFLLPGIGPMFHTLDDLTPFCLKIDYPEAYDDFTIMNLKTYNSLPADIRNIVIEEVHGWISKMDRAPMSTKGWEYNNALVKAGKLSIIQLTPSDRAWCKQQWETKLVDIWIKKQIAAGFKDAKAYLDDVLNIRDSILAKGLPLYPGEIL